MWIKTVWQYISPDMTVKEFRKCCIFNAVHETDDDMLWNLVKRTGMLGGSVRKCEDGESDTDLSR